MYFSNASSLASEPSTSASSTPDTDKSVLFDGISPSIDDLQYILVTGGLGFIGSHTSLELLKAGYNVIIVDDLSNSFRSVFDRIVAAGSLHFSKIDCECPQLKLWDINYRDEVAMRGLIQAHTLDWRSHIIGVIHFAAFKAVEESIRNPLKYYHNNINGLVNFLSLLGEYGIKNFIFSSSATVYGLLADRGLPLREEDCVHQPENFHGADGLGRQAVQGFTSITNPYGRTKLFGEAILADVAASDPSWNITALRYFNPIGCDVSGLLGEDPRGTPSNLVPVVVKVMMGQWKELSVFGSDWNTPDGTAIRDFIHVTDLARGHIAALSATLGKSRAGFRAYNLGTGSGHSVNEIISTMESVSRIPIRKKIVGRRAGDVGSCVAVTDRAARELNWKTEKTLKDACTDICNFLTVQA